jgi:DeoR/GlpR family transcriptional regulator of sugar metabolism
VAAIGEGGLYNSNVLQVETQKAMIAAGDEVIVVADSTKFGHRSLAHICELGAVDRLVVDSEISDDWQRKIRAAGVELSVAKLADTE